MSIDQELLRVSAECDRLIAERDALIRAVADHVTVRAEQYAQIQALAARVQEMREALKWINKYPSKPSEELGYVGCRRVAGEALSTPDTSAQILARRDAATLQTAAFELEKKNNEYANEVGYFEYDTGAWVCENDYANCRLEATDDAISFLRAKADELLKGLEKEHG